jgi:hypothetical protein
LWQSAARTSPTSPSAERAKEAFRNTKRAMINSFASVIESTKQLSLRDDRQRSAASPEVPTLQRQSKKSNESAIHERA